METPFTLINISKKLRSLQAFTGCRGIVLQWIGETYSYPENVVEHLNESSSAVERIPLQDGRLIFINPTADKKTLSFLADNLEEEIELARLFDAILEAGTVISSNLNLKPLLHKVMRLSEEIFDNEVSAVMLLHPEKKELYWEVSRCDDSELFERNMTLPLGQGIGGHVAQTRESALVNDVHEDPRWSPDYDEKSGFRTKSLMCVPVKFHGDILGVIEVINKKQGDFTFRDLKLLETFASQAAGAIENAKIYGKLEQAYEDLKILDKAKERIINHLSHELRTPLAIIAGVLGQISRELEKRSISKLENALERGRRNVKRLQDLQAVTQDILDHMPVEQTTKISNKIEDALNFIDIIREKDETNQDVSVILENIAKRLESVRHVKEVRTEKIAMDRFLNELCDETALCLKGRQLEIVRNFEEGIVLKMDKDTLRKICEGLLKNAIENTPDEGKIEIGVKIVEKDIEIYVHDYGIGITPENQRMIFGGFFHTQDTKNYSSKKPYQFNAGGSGSDLLRTKVFSESLGFSVDYKGTRCKHLPEDKDECPGKISNCPFIKDAADCFCSGESLFAVRFPLQRFGCS